MRLLPWTGLAVSCLITLTYQASAWNNTGHKTVALLAYRDPKLTDKQRLKIVQILKAHPHYDRFIAADQPSNVKATEWAVARAATWPDWVRPRLKDRRPDEAEINKTYHIPDWHFINKTLIFPAEEKNVDRSKIKMPDKDIVKALNMNVELLTSRNTDPKEQAISLCWLLHLVGDIQQPAHCAMMFSSQFPAPDGDRGANNILVVPGTGHAGTKLHAIWDDLLGHSLDFKEADDNAVRISADSTRSRKALNGELTRNRTFAAWADDSYEKAKESVYLKGELKGASHQHGHFDGPFVIPHLPNNYLENARKVAEAQVALAGYRLADQLAACIKAQ